MFTPRVSTSRRTAIALTLAAPLALAACDLDPPSATPAPSPTAAPLPDAEVVTTARTAILRTIGLLEAVSALHRPLRAETRALLAMHAAHLAVLDDGSADQVTDSDVPETTPASARAQVSLAENGLAGTLFDTARQAASGDLARALASMSAAVTQRVTV